MLFMQPLNACPIGARATNTMTAHAIFPFASIWRVWLHLTKTVVISARPQGTRGNGKPVCSTFAGCCQHDGLCHITFTGAKLMILLFLNHGNEYRNPRFFGFGP